MAYSYRRGINLAGCGPIHKRNLEKLKKVFSLEKLGPQAGHLNEVPLWFTSIEFNLIQKIPFGKLQDEREY
ncbi:hypothetical protein D0962_36500 [Leptolyngbyaceae cyanobacterium CCMR0082]|uniref:Uncharacterized protein n=2 Tax=Adonisia turfae TaxID=2950184 RepID=A0A6M0SJR6_9CYAN|nr:hypothetical protein [Adonisia turfae CCMR0081]NEZ68171.1 hypothetical protein [Adonisia turfae CCMR0082]